MQLPLILEPSWQEALREELSKPYLVKIAAFIEKEYATTPDSTYPPQNLIFNAFDQTPFDKVKVVIMGQDPYHGPGQAHGLCFSVPKGIPPPPSLKNIFLELKNDVDLPIPSHGCLISWAKAGVLLLNTTLTVNQGKPLSHHGKGWEFFTDAVIQKLIEKEEPLIFVLWGKSAQDKCRLLLNSTKMAVKHFVLTAAHPSPFSAHRGFFGCHHFSKINEILNQLGKSQIKWDLDSKY